MAQHDYVIDNSTGANVRADINNVLQAIATNNSGSSDPSTTLASQFFADTNAGIMKLRNTANNGYVNLFTLAGGVDVDAASNFNEDVTFTGASANIVFDKSDSCLEFADNAKAKFGASDDLQIYHDGSNSYFRNSTGFLNIKTTGGGAHYIDADDQYFRTSGGENLVKMIGDGAVELYFDASKKLETKSGGVQVTGNLMLDTDSDKAIFGAGNDLQIFHDGSDSFIKDTGTGALKVCSNLFRVNNAANSEAMIKAEENGAVELYHDSSKKFETTANGVIVTGDMTLDSGGGLNIDTGEFGMTSASGTPKNRFMDFGFLNNTLFMRRTDGGEVSHSAFLEVSSSKVVSGDLNDTSDKKLKKNITSIADGAISIIKQLRPVTFDWIDETQNNNVSGFIAQEVKTILPNLVNGTEYDPTFNDESLGSKGGIKSGGYSINSVGITAHLTKALQEAIAKIETLETKVAALEAA